MSRTIHPILIVEDDAPTQMLLGTLMQRYGYETVVAENGKTAMELLAERDFTAIILDLMMPQVGGVDVVAFLARENKSVPVIVCTAAGLDKTSEFEPNIVGAVLRKPFDIEEMMSTIFRLAGHSMPSTVLIVDDDVKSRFALRALLAPATPLEADSGDAAQAILREQRPEVIVATDRVAAELSAEAVPLVVIAAKPVSKKLRQRAAAVIDRKTLSRQTLTDAFDAVLQRG